MFTNLLVIKWHELFVPSESIFEIIIRGTITYLALFLLMRFVLKREAGSIGTADLLMIVLIADAAQNAMSNGYKSITEGVILVCTIMFWNLAIDWASYHSPALRRVLQPQPLILVKNGRMNRHNMRKELITKEELLGELREQGINDLSLAKEVRIEEDGHISVVKKKNKSE
jgi:uncharacterized membrane protein YcaP (DUF421 family)